MRCFLHWNSKLRFCNHVFASIECLTLWNVWFAKPMMGARILSQKTNYWSLEPLAPTWGAISLESLICLKWKTSLKFSCNIEAVCLELWAEHGTSLPVGAVHHKRLCNLTLWSVTGGVKVCVAKLPANTLCAWISGQCPYILLVSLLSSPCHSHLDVSRETSFSSLVICCSNECNEQRVVWINPCKKLQSFDTRTRLISWTMNLFSDTGRWSCLSPSSFIAWLKVMKNPSSSLVQTLISFVCSCCDGNSKIFKTWTIQKIHLFVNAEECLNFNFCSSWGEKYIACQVWYWSDDSTSDGVASYDSLGPRFGKQGRDKVKPCKFDTYYLSDQPRRKHATPYTQHRTPLESWSGHW